MKIAQIIPNLKTGGAEIMCENLTKYLYHTGYQVFVISLYNEITVISQRLEKLGVKVYYLNKKRGFDYSIVKCLLKVFKEEKPDVIHAHLYAASYSMLAAIILGINSRVVTIHSLANEDNSKMGRLLNMLLFKHFKTVPVALSQQIQDTIVQQYKIGKEKVPIIYNGIDLKRCIIKENYSISNGLKIIHVGRFSAVKNHYSLINGFEKVVAQLSDAKLILVGDGELLHNCQKIVADKQLEKNVFFYGQSSNVFPLYSKSDLFILPSKYEGMPMTIIEAMGSGMPIIASCVGGIKDMLVDNVSGILIEPVEEQIFDAIIRLGKDESLRKAIGQEALALSIHYSVEAMAEKYCKIYTQQLGK